MELRGTPYGHLHVNRHIRITLADCCVPFYPVSYKD